MNSKFLRRSLLVLLPVLAAAPSAGQEPAETCAPAARLGMPGADGQYADYYRMLSLLSERPAELLIRRPSSAVTPLDGCSRSLWEPGPARQGALRAGLRVDGLYNSAYVRGYETGLLWPGKGWGTVIAPRLELRKGVFSVGIEPELALHTNSDFRTVVRPQRDSTASVFSYPWHAPGGRPKIDWPQRHGDERIAWLTAGQSYARVDAYGVAAGVSNENLWWGPSFRNSLVLGNEAPGFAHAFLGTSNGFTSVAGRVDVQVVWGLLEESDHFDTDPDNDRRMLAGMMLAWQPPGLTGLSLGAARVFNHDLEGSDVGPGDLFPFFQSPRKDDLVDPTNPLGNDVKDQVFGFSARYAVPAAGFEVYGEWARNDHAQNLSDFIGEPEHARAYTIGFQQVSAGEERWFRVRGEVTNLAATRTADHRGNPTFYVHSSVRAGYTHRGQLLGAAVGPGSDTQFLGFDMFTPAARHGIFLERVRYDDDTYNTFNSVDFYAHDVELTAGTEHFIRLGPVDVRLGLSYSNRRNRHFRFCSRDTGPEFGCKGEPFTDRNWSLPVGLVWRPGLTRSGAD